MSTKSMLNTEEMEQIPEHLRSKVQSLQNESSLADEWVKAQEASDQAVRETVKQSLSWFKRQPTLIKVGVGGAALIAFALRKRI